MNGLVILAAVIGGGIGATLRFVIDGLIMRRVTSGYPWGTAVINATGSFLVGLLTGLADSSVLDSPWLFIIGSGLMGGYTTFGSAMVDTVHLIQKGRIRDAWVNGLGMIVVTVLVATLGLLLGRAL